MRKVAVPFVLVLAMVSLARADLNINLNSGPVANGANFNWTYTAILRSGSTLNTGDFFTIYDIDGFGPGVPIANNVILPGAGWSFSIQLLGINGFAQSPPDNPSLPNLTFIYTGPPIVAFGDTVLAGAGAFGYTSFSSMSATAAYSAMTHITAGGAPAGNTSLVTVAAVPEPSAILLSGVGLIALGFLVRRRCLV